MGDEGRLQKELLSAVKGQRTETKLYLKNRNSVSYFNGTGSQNIWLMWAVTRHLKGESLDISQMYDYQLNKWFGGSEFLSSIYWTWHVLSHVALLRSENEEVKSLTLQWLNINWSLFREIAGPNGAVLCYGQRSVGHMPHPSSIDWLHAVAKGDVQLERKAEQWCREAHLGLRNSWEYAMGQELRPELRMSYDGSKLPSVDELKSSLKLRVHSTIIQTSNGVALVHSQTCNANTAPILVSKYDGEELSTFPSNGGFRFRKFDDARTFVDVESRQIVYSSAVFTGGKELRMNFPSGEVKNVITLGE